jgi:formylglycine-generating enzyme
VVTRGRRAWSQATALFMSLALPLVGCNLLLGIEKDYVEASDAGGAAGASSSRTTSSSAGSTSVGSSGGGAGTGAGGGSGSGAGGGGGALVCPTGFGPAMVSAGSYCIDVTEVTNAQYAAWLATSPSVGSQEARCAGNDDFTPVDDWPAPANRANYPVINVDWCDAFAFCEGSGKRLCGAIAGGELALGAYADASESQWHRACTSGGSTDYPYGDAYSGDACVGSDYDNPDRLNAVGAAGGCTGYRDPWSTVHDMSGNAQEWEDACAGDGPNDVCRRRGGSYVSSASKIRCDADESASRLLADSRTGFRCCAD